MKKTNHVKVKFLMTCWVIFVFTFSFGLNAAEISRDARKHMIRGQAAMEEAKDVADYQDAVTEFKKATQYAPEWADAWFNLGVAQEKTGGYADAINSFNKYLDLNPNAADSSEVEARTFKLEYKQDQQVKQEQDKLQSEREERERQEKYGSLLGTWDMKVINTYAGNSLVRIWGTFTLSKQGSIIEGYAKETSVQFQMPGTDDNIVSANNTEQVLRGTINGSVPIEIRWEVNVRGVSIYCPEGGGWRSANIHIRADKKRISFRIPKLQVLRDRSGCRDGDEYREYVLTR